MSPGKRRSFRRRFSALSQTLLSNLQEFVPPEEGQRTLLLSRYRWCCAGQTAPLPVAVPDFVSTATHCRPAMLARCPLEAPPKANSRIRQITYATAGPRLVTKKAILQARSEESERPRNRSPAGREEAGPVADKMRLTALSVSCKSKNRQRCHWQRNRSYSITAHTKSRTAASNSTSSQGA